jgi:hypothetical protein
VYIGAEVYAVVVTKSSVYFDITPCSLLKVNGRFGGTFCLYLQGRRISKVRNQHEAPALTDYIYNRKLVRSIFSKLTSRTML